MQIPSNPRTKVHPLFLLLKIELHLIDPFDLLNHPTLRLCLPQHFNKVEHISYHIFHLGYSLISEGDVDVELGIAVVAIRSSG